MLLLTLALLIFFLLVGRKLGFLSPSSLFLCSQYAMAIGIVPTLDMGKAADRTHQDLLLFTFFSYIVGSLLVIGALGRRSSRRAYSPIVDFHFPANTVYIWILISIVIGVAYYVAIGYVAFFESMSAVIEGSDTDVAGLRLESYAGSRYLYPGYVNQFKNSLLPALLLVVITAAFRCQKPNRWLMAFGLGSTAILLLIGTGQRHPFFKALVIAVLFAYYIVPKISIRGIMGFGLMGGSVYVVTTFASGRASSDLEQAKSLGDIGSVFLTSLVGRIFSSNQLSGTVGFRYIYHQEDIPIASEWIKSFIGLLPGQSGSDIANRIFQVLYGGTRGTSPLSLWGSAYYNFGFWGAVLLAGLLGAFLALLSAAFLRRKQLNLIQAVGMAGITAALGLWVSGSPTSLFNDGIVVFILLLIWGDRFENSTRSSRAVRGHLVRNTKAQPRPIDYQTIAKLP